MKKKQPAGLVKTTIRIPRVLLTEMRGAASENCHSLNAELVAAMRSWLAGGRHG